MLAWGAFGALAAEWALVESRRAPQAETIRARPRFVGTGLGEVREIDLWRQGRRVVSRRERAGWRLVEPTDADVPADLIAAFANALSDAEEISRIDPGTEAAAFGLDDTATRVEVRGEHGAITVTIGGTNPTGTAVYARRQDSPDVVLIGRNVRYYGDLIFQALAADRVPAADGDAPIGG